MNPSEKAAENSGMSARAEFERAWQFVAAQEQKRVTEYAVQRTMDQFQEVIEQKKR